MSYKTTPAEQLHEDSLQEITLDDIDDPNKQQSDLEKIEGLGPGLTGPSDKKNFNPDFATR